MSNKASKYECDNCGKQLWKIVWVVNCGDGYLESCSKKCAKKLLMKSLDDLTVKMEICPGGLREYE